MSGKDRLVAPLATPWESYRGDGDKPRQWPCQVHEASAVLDESGAVVLVLDSSPCPLLFPALEVVVTVARVVDGLLGMTDTVGCEDCDCETLLPPLGPPEDPPEHKLEASPTGYVVPLLHVLLETSYNSVVSTGSPSGASLIIVSWPPGSLSSQSIWFWPPPWVFDPVQRST